MYCPNCGIEIHLEGSYCAKCQKSTAYLTQKRLVNFIVPTNPSESAPIPNASADSAIGAEDAPNPVEDAPPPAEIVPENAGENASAPPVGPILVAPASPKEEGFYCNFCGTFIYEEDNFCYNCGKATRKQYYKSAPHQKKKKFMFGIGATAALILLIMIGYLVYR